MTSCFAALYIVHVYRNTVSVLYCYMYVSAFSGGVPVLDLDCGTTSDKTLAHMSMATRQYLEKHNLIRTPQAAGGLEEEGRTTKLPCDSERILDVKRLKTLPKLF